MTQSEFHAKVAEEAGITKAAAGRIVSFIGKTIVADLLLDGRSVFPGLGIFSVVTRAPKAYRNPQNGNIVEKPARKAVKFKATQAVKNQFASD